MCLRGSRDNLSWVCAVSLKFVMVTSGYLTSFLCVGVSFSFVMLMFYIRSIVAKGAPFSYLALLLSMAMLTLDDIAKLQCISTYVPRTPCGTRHDYGH